MRNKVCLVTMLLLLGAIPLLAGDVGMSIIYDVPQADMKRCFGEEPATKLTAEQLKEMASYRFDGDTLRILVILVDWTDRPGVYSQATFDSIFFSDGVYPGGSVADYFEESSYNQVKVTGDVLDWYTLNSYDPNFYYPDMEDILYDLDPVVDYSQYDGDHDGIADAVIFLRSGNGQEDSGDLNDVWSFAMSYYPGYGPGPFDGVVVSNYCTSPETRPLRNPINPQMFLGVDTLNRISVACHELTHNLGMPDMYDYDDKLEVSTYETPNDYNDHPVVDWCLMGYGGYGLLSIGQITPPHHIGWMKTQLGWIEPILLDQGEYSDLVIYNIETTPDSSLYKVPIDLENGEYFLLEYRNPQADALFDKFDSDFSTYLWPWVGFGADSLDRGLLVTHIHDSLGAEWWRINNGTPDNPHYTVAVVDAGYDPARDASFNPEGFVSDSAQWWYPYETRKAATFSSEVPGQETLSPTTTPSSAGYYGPTGITITVDSIVDDRLYVSISTDQDNDGYNNAEDNCPEDYNPGQEDGDSDGAGDICDNCPGLYNPDQNDPDEDGFGSLCDNCPDEYNVGQADGDSDGKGDVCDNCPEDYNPGQEDANENGIGDVCDYVCGDANNDDAVNLLDILFVIDFLYGSPTGPAPENQNAADVNAEKRHGCSLCDGVQAMRDRPGPCPQSGTKRRYFSVHSAGGPSASQTRHLGRT